MIEVQRRQTPANLRPKIHTRNIKSPPSHTMIVSGYIAAIVACERRTKNVNSMCSCGSRTVRSWFASHRWQLSLSSGGGGTIEGDTRRIVVVDNIANVTAPTIRGGWCCWCVIFLVSDSWHIRCTTIDGQLLYNFVNKKNSLFYFTVASAK